MVEYEPCVVMIDHRVKYLPVHRHGSVLYVKLNGKRLKEKDLPFGIEVKI
jgi:hypothetical protein